MLSRKINHIYLKRWNNWYFQKTKLRPFAKRLTSLVGDEWWKLHFWYFFCPFRTSKLLSIIFFDFYKHNYFYYYGVVSFCWGAWNDGEISLIGKFSFFFMFSSEFNEWQVLLSLWFRYSEKCQRSNDGTLFILQVSDN